MMKMSYRILVFYSAVNKSETWRDMDGSVKYSCVAKVIQTQIHKSHMFLLTGKLLTYGVHTRVYNRGMSTGCEMREGPQRWKEVQSRAVEIET